MHLGISIVLGVTVLLQLSNVDSFNINANSNRGNIIPTLSSGISLRMTNREPISTNQAIKTKVA